MFCSSRATPLSECGVIWIIKWTRALSTQSKAFDLRFRRWEKIGVEGLRKYTASIERCACVTVAEGGHQNIEAKG